MFEKRRIALGEGFLDRTTIFEFKKFFSAYFHVFNTVAQDRFHTHAFHGIAIVLRGWYDEEWKDEDGTVRTKRIKPGVRFIPRSYNHRLMRSSPNTMSILFTGPWAKHWTEEKDGTVRTLGWGRKIVETSPALHT